MAIVWLKLTRPDGLSVAINPEAISYFTAASEADYHSGSKTVLNMLDGHFQAVTESFTEITEMLNALHSVRLRGDRQEGVGG